MMKRIYHPFFSVLSCTGMLVVVGIGASVSDAVNAESSDFLTDSQDKYTQYQLAHLLHSKCRRHGVVWSSGVASRFSDRISPRPVRSRWDNVEDDRIRCKGVDEFKRLRVSDQPSIK